jgi:hypothetical protein
MRDHAGRPLGRLAGRPEAASDLARAMPSVLSPANVKESRSARVIFDPQNPYGN